MSTISKPRFRAVDITFVGMFAALMAFGANITSWAPFLQVANIPLSMQPFFAILAGLLLGSRLGAISMTVYMLIGMAGAPVFAQFSAGISPIFGGSGGFILSYIATAFIVGKIVESKSKPALTTFMIASFAGITTIYFIGTNYMYFAYNLWLDFDMGYATAWKVMAWFAVKDIMFTIFGALIAPRIYHTIKRTSRISSIQTKAS
ncbi:biotin transporter BioY [Cytobacillus sp. S13-E01]|uniref:biotin transporter BioY n=1 Tax=Cytobacillus sp. S13-E01 TaxID=3031326 RepID=UPI0023D852C3|nr:biotin transporter BioY [Cytobacillus sp. S13-E01]MDF0727412.1 biotin transporter BioY [Cytobacillus sp. S13-E01]